MAGTPPDAAWTEIGGNGQPLVFTHANGFPPGTYRALLELLAERFRVTAYANRALWSDGDPSEVTSWHPLAEDLRRGLDSRGQGPVVGVGHSIGGMLCLLAAARAPHVFSSLVVLDPVVFTGWPSFLWGWMKRLRQGRRFPLAAGALKRKDRWSDRTAARRSWAGKPVFSTWRSGVLDDYIEAGLVEAPGGTVTLRYPKRWEARLFEVCPHNEWSELRRVSLPCLVVRGETSDTLLPAAAGRMGREMPDARVVELAGTSHFLPMENPDEVASLVFEFAGGGSL